MAILAFWPSHCGDHPAGGVTFWAVVARLVTERDEDQVRPCGGSWDVEVFQGVVVTSTTMDCISRTVARVESVRSSEIRRNRLHLAFN